MSLLVLMLASCGMAFWVQYKLLCHYQWLYNIASCSYCVGFWCGWITWVLAWVANGSSIVGSSQAEIAIGGTCWAFASAACNYMFDTVTTYMSK